MTAPRFRIDADRPDGQWSVYRIDATDGETWVGAYPTAQAADEMARYLAYREPYHERFGRWPARKVYP